MIGSAAEEAGSSLDKETARTQSFAGGGSLSSERQARRQDSAAKEMSAEGDPLSEEDSDAETEDEVYEEYASGSAEDIAATSEGDEGAVRAMLVCFCGSPMKSSDAQRARAAYSS
jgi:hypothetical protein